MVPEALRMTWRKQMTVPIRRTKNASTFSFMWRTLVANASVESWTAESFILAGRLGLTGP
jgi:hypothetical protein